MASEVMPPRQASFSSSENWAVAPALPAVDEMCETAAQVDNISLLAPEPTFAIDPPSGVTVDELDSPGFAESPGSGDGEDHCDDSIVPAAMMQEMVTNLRLTMQGLSDETSTRRAEIHSVQFDLGNCFKQIDRLQHCAEKSKEHLDRMEAYAGDMCKLSSSMSDIKADILEHVEEYAADVRNLCASVADIKKDKDGGMHELRTSMSDIKIEMESLKGLVQNLRLGETASLQLDKALLQNKHVSTLTESRTESTIDQTEAWSEWSERLSNSASSRATSVAGGGLEDGVDKITFLERRCDDLFENVAMLGEMARRRCQEFDARSLEQSSVINSLGEALEDAQAKVQQQLKQGDQQRMELSAQHSSYEAKMETVQNSILQLQSQLQQRTLTDAEQSGGHGAKLISLQGSLAQLRSQFHQRIMEDADQRGQLKAQAAESMQKIEILQQSFSELEGRQQQQVPERNDDRRFISDQMLRLDAKFEEQDVALSHLRQYIEKQVAPMMSQEGRSPSSSSFPQDAGAGTNSLETRLQELQAKVSEQQSAFEEFQGNLDNLLQSLRIRLDSEQRAVNAAAEAHMQEHLAAATGPMLDTLRSEVRAVTSDLYTRMAEQRQDFTNFCNSLEKPSGEEIGGEVATTIIDEKVSADLPSSGIRTQSIIVESPSVSTLTNRPVETPNLDSPMLPPRTPECPQNLPLPAGSIEHQLQTDASAARRYPLVMRTSELQSPMGSPPHTSRSVEVKPATVSPNPTSRRLLEIQATMASPRLIGRSMEVKPASCSIDAFKSPQRMRRPEEVQPVNRSIDAFRSPQRMTHPVSRSGDAFKSPQRLSRQEAFKSPQRVRSVDGQPNRPGSCYMNMRAVPIDLIDHQQQPGQLTPRMTTRSTVSCAADTGNIITPRTSAALMNSYAASIQQPHLGGSACVPPRDLSGSLCVTPRELSSSACAPPREQVTSNSSYVAPARQAVGALPAACLPGTPRGNPLVARFVSCPAVAVQAGAPNFLGPARNSEYYTE